MIRATLRRAGVTAGVLALAAGLISPAAAADGTTCRTVAVPVTVAGQTGPIAGTLCSPPGADVVQLLVHGWTYDRNYFDWPVEPDTYSYARAANRAGYATLAIDRLGTGASLRPPSLFDTFNTGVEAVHKVVSALRNGSLGTRFGKVISVGHSLGSVTVAQEAGQFKDVDGLITTGYLHTINYLNMPMRVLGRDYPAMSDPKFAGSTPDPLFLTNLPGTRHTFYNESNADPAVIAADERLKAEDSLIDFATAAAFNLNNADRELNIPVLVVTGDKDLLFCGLASQDCGSADQLAAHERPWYGPGATVDAYLPANTGHDTQLERTAPQSTQAMLAFADRRVGAGSGQRGTEPGVRPAVAAPPPTQPSPAAAAAAMAFQTAVLPLADAYADAVRDVPGLGDTSNPLPEANDLLVKIANLTNQTLGSLPPQLIGAL